MTSIDNSHLSEIRFSELPLHDKLQQGLNKMGFEYCTPIQALTLPISLAGKDVAGQAQTGTGKTAAFLLTTMNVLLNEPADAKQKSNQPRALIIAPTRELAIQIHKDAEILGQSTDLKLGLVYGGVDYDKQRKSLNQGIDILIGTPGRIIDYFKQKVFDLQALQVAVLDEADRMFDLGFIKDIRFLFRRMPKPEKRQSMMFSATLSFKVKELAYEHMNNPQSLEAKTDNVTADSVTQVLYHVQNEEKIPLLIGLLNQIDAPRAIIFVNTKRVAEKVTGWLLGNDYKAGLISGDVPQKKRERLIREVESGDIGILIATDVAARGIHIPDVTHVFNYDLPQNEEDYVHRIGRTARAGASGIAISFGCEEFVFSLMEIEAYIGHKIPVENITNEMLAEPKPAQRLKTKKPPANGRRPQKNRSRNPRSSNHQANNKPSAQHSSKTEKID